MLRLKLAAAVLMLTMALGTVTRANQPPGAAPVYQRYGHGAFSGAKYGPAHSARGSFYSRRAFVPRAQQSQSFQFQRPYPYHLDYYRMRYGGSYAPYFGNLYGPPQVYAPSNFQGGYFMPYGAPSAYPGPPIDGSPPMYHSAPTGPPPTEAGPATGEE